MTQLAAKLSNPTLAAFRVVIGFLFACHGAATLFGAFGRDSAELGAWPGWWAGIIQLVGGTLVVAGLGTRIAALICSGSMAYAYFVEHQSDGVLPIQNMGEAAAMFCWSFLLIAILGAGSASIDGLIARGGRRATQQTSAAKDSSEPKEPSLINR
ncbi:MAG: DoxX family protein [Pseudonocardiaceae bacterium]